MGKKNTADIHKIGFNRSLPVHGLMDEYAAYTTKLGGSQMMERGNNHGQNCGKLT